MKTEKSRDIDKQSKNNSTQNTTTMTNTDPTKNPGVSSYTVKPGKCLVGDRGGINIKWKTFIAI